jgi:hypothetical protein
MHKQLKKGDRFYLITSKGKFLRKITYLNNEKLEWAGGFAREYQMKRNEDIFSSVKWVLDYTYHEKNQLPNPPSEIYIKI